MNYDCDRVDEMVLALLYLTSSHDEYGTKAWKGMDLAALNRLFLKGYIGDPKGKTAAVPLTEKGAKLSQKLFFSYFGIKE